VSEILSAEKWLYTVLNNDTQLKAKAKGIYSGLVPSGTAFPLVYITLQRQDADLITNGAHRVWATLHYAVRAVDETGSWGSDLKTIANRIDAVLHAASGSSSEGTVYECVREQPFAIVEQADGRQFRHLGGLYQLRVI
jgi:hypothetical protein